MPTPISLLLGGLTIGAAVTARLWPPAALELRELRNKMEAYALFRDGEAVLSEGTSPGSKYRRLWGVEGRAYAAGARAARRARWEELRELLRREAPAVPGVSYALPRHTGAGLGVASVLLETAAVPGEVVARFREAVEWVAEPRYRSAMLENLGLAVRLLRPEALLSFDASLQQRYPDQVDLFWHGVGRGLYFAPSTLWGLGGWPSLHRAVTEPPDETARRNAVSGVAWALALVNVRHPAVVARRLGELDGEPRWRYCAAEGVASALALWHAATGDGATLDRFFIAAGGSLGWGEAGGVHEARTAVVAEARSLLGGEIRVLAQEGRLAETFRAGPAPTRGEPRV